MDLVEAEVPTAEEEEVGGTEEPTNRSTMWAPAVVALTLKEASRITMIIYRAGRTTMRRFLPWAAAYLMASEPVRLFPTKILVCVKDDMQEKHYNGSLVEPPVDCSVKTAMV